MINQIYDPFMTIKAWASLMSEVMGTEGEAKKSSHMAIRFSRT